jgi:hypothetical protein
MSHSNDVELEMLTRQKFCSRFVRIKFEEPMASAVKSAGNSEKKNFEDAVSCIIGNLVDWWNTPSHLRPELGLPISLSSGGYKEPLGSTNRYLGYRAMRSAYEWLKAEELLVLTQKGYSVKSPFGTKASASYIQPTEKLLLLLGIVEEGQ